MRESSKKNYVEGTNLSQIACNTIAQNNTSGIRGVSWHKGLQKWQARITIKGKTVSLGYYNNIEDAAAARKEAEEKYFDPILEKHKRK